MRIVFMGTSEFAVPALNALANSEHQVLAVWTRPDKPRGRGHHIEVSPVKRAATDLGLPIYQPPTLRTPEAVEVIARVRPEVICVASYGLILPPTVLDLPRQGCVNVHASLLPRYRGAAPIHRAIIAGDTFTGVTTMKMDQGLDTGDMLLREEQPIGPEATFGEIHDALSIHGASLLIRTLALMETGDCPRTPQETSQATYAPPVQKEECELHWNRSAIDLHNLVRGTNPRPGAFTHRGGTVLRVHRTRSVVENTPMAKGPAGTLILTAGKPAPLVICGAGALELLEVQPAGGKRMAGEDYLRGRPVQPGEQLGTHHA